MVEMRAPMVGEIQFKTIILARGRANSKPIDCVIQTLRNADIMRP